MELQCSSAQYRETSILKKPQTKALSLLPVTCVSHSTFTNKAHMYIFNENVFSKVFSRNFEWIFFFLVEQGPGII